MKSPLALPVLIFNLLLLSATAQAQVVPLHIYQLDLQEDKIPHQLEFNQLANHNSESNTYFNHLVSKQQTADTAQLLVIQQQGHSPIISLVKQHLTTQLIEETTGKMLRSLHKRYGEKGLKDTVLSSFEAAINKRHIYEIETYKIDYAPYSIETAGIILNGQNPQSVATLDFQKQANNSLKILTANATDKCLEENQENFKEFMQQNYKDVLADMNIFAKVVGTIERTVALNGAVNDVFNDIRRLILKPTFPNQKQLESLEQFAKLPAKLTTFEFSELPAGSYSLNIDLPNNKSKQQQHLKLNGLNLDKNNKYLLVITTN